MPNMKIRKVDEDSKREKCQLVAQSYKEILYLSFSRKTSTRKAFFLRNPLRFSLQQLVEHCTWYSIPPSSLLVHINNKLFPLCLPWLHMTLSWSKFLFCSEKCQLEWQYTLLLIEYVFLKNAKRLGGSIMQYSWLLIMHKHTPKLF